MRTGTMAAIDVHGAAASRGTTSAVLSIDRLGLELGGQQLLADVSFSVGRGEVVGLVGESGSGKTLTGLSILGLTPPRARLRGSIRFEGRELVDAPPAVVRSLRGTRLSMIFQEPRSSLNPAISIGRQIVDVIRVHDRAVGRREARSRAVALLGQVGIPNPRALFGACPHELSGGMCQRAMVAMALSGDPDMLVADEPTTALDVTVQAQIVTLLRSIAEQRRLSILLVSHNLAVVSTICDRVVTMYCGQVVNVDTTRRVVDSPSHPYTRALLVAAGRASATATAPGPASAPGPAEELVGRPANPANPPAGCRYWPRCPYAQEQCSVTEPTLAALGDGRSTRCLRHGELSLAFEAS